MSITFKRHYKLLLLLIAVVAFCLTVFRDTRIIAYTVKGNDVAAVAITNYDNDIALFDDTVVHEVIVLISAADQDKMVDTFRETEEKDYFLTDVIIDGVRINSVGLRLKGNASLSMAMGVGLDMGGGMPGFGGGGFPALPPGFAPAAGFPFPEGFQMPEGFQLPEGFSLPEEFQMPEGFELPEGFPMPGFGGENSIPYLIKFDEFVPGQRYQGYAEIALRTAGVFPDAALLQEPVSNYVMNRVGIPISQSVYASVQLTGNEPRLYTIAEQIDPIYIARLFPESDGVLYKVNQIGNPFRYLGADPTLYFEIFEQKTATGTADLAPLIDFIRFVTESTDEEFAAQLPGQLDVAAFADYLALHNLLANNDSLPGMGNNYYLYYDFNSEMFTILSWDSNEGLGKIAMALGDGPETDIYWENVAFGAMFGGLGQEQAGDAPESAIPPAGDTGIAGDEEATAVPPSGGFGGMGRHLLKERFFDNPDFLSLYEERYQLLYEQIYVNDLLTPKIEEFAALVTAYNAERDVVDQAEFDTAVAGALDFVSQRHDYLRTTELLGE